MHTNTHTHTYTYTYYAEKENLTENLALQPPHNYKHIFSALTLQVPYVITHTHIHTHTHTHTHLYLYLHHCLIQVTWSPLPRRRSKTEWPNWKLHWMWSSQFKPSCPTRYLWAKEIFTHPWARHTTVSGKDGVQPRVMAPYIRPRLETTSIPTLCEVIPGTCN